MELVEKLHGYVATRGHFAVGVLTDPKIAARCSSEAVRPAGCWGSCSGGGGGDKTLEKGADGVVDGSCPVAICLVGALKVLLHQGAAAAPGLDDNFESHSSYFGWIRARTAIFGPATAVEYSYSTKDPACCASTCHRSS